MGFITLEEFREEIQNSTGNLGLENTRLTRYVNSAYFEVAGAVDFSELLEIQETAILANESTIPLSPNVSAVLSVAHSDHLMPSYYGPLGYRAAPEFLRNPQFPAGVPKIWTRIGTDIVFRPEADAIYPINIIHKSSPFALAVDTEKTVLPNTWDPAISLLAVHFAKMALGQQDAVAFYNRAVQYMATRIVDEERLVVNTGLGKAIRAEIGTGGA